MAQLLMVTASGEQHGLINTLPNSCKDTGFEGMSPEVKAKCEKLRKDEARIVKARYINHRGMHERLTKPYMRYAGDPIRIWHLIPGHTYDLPYGFVKEINESPGLAQRGEKMVDGEYIAKDQAPMRLHELVPISF